jgi:hypothetical protein
MKDNYSAWKIDINAFDRLVSYSDKLKFLVKFAVLAPSSHNTQPWYFQISKNAISVYKDGDRRLRIADENDRQLYLSIGCAIENLIVSANYYNLNTTIEYCDNTNDDLAATIHFSEKVANISQDHSLIESIITRRTNRNKYKKDRINPETLKELKSYESEEIEITIVDDENKLYNLAQIAVLASIESMIDEEFRKELSKHIKHNLTKSNVGMPGFTLGLPTPLSFVLPHLIKKFNMEKLAQKQNLELLTKYTPYIVIIASKHDSKKDWLACGRVYQQLNLNANKYNISTSPWGAPIQIGQFYNEISKIIESEKRPQMFFRMGYAQKNTRFSPRLSADQVIK